MFTLCHYAYLHTSSCPRFMHRGSFLEESVDACRDLLVDDARPEWVGELLRYRGHAGLAAEMEAWAIPAFPLSGKVRGGVAQGTYWVTT